MQRIKLDLRGIKKSEPQIGNITLVPDDDSVRHVVTLATGIVPSPQLHQHIELAETDLNDPKQYVPQSRPPVNKPLLVSLIIHGVLVTGFLLSSVLPPVFQPPIKNTVIENLAPIQATLYFPKITQETVPKQTETVIPEPTEPLNPEKIIKTAPEIVSAQSSETPPAQPTQPPQPENQTTELPSIAKTTEADTQQTLPADSGSRLHRLNQALSSHLNNLSEQKIQSLTESATNRREEQFYRQQTKGYQLPFEEPQMKVKKINCSNTVGMAAGAISGLLGGNLRCTEQPDFQRFIDARLNKQRKD